MSTPVRQQYLRIKHEYPNTILFFRLGDFYETFDDDARIVAGVCDIVLTSRPVGQNERVPLAGVPYHNVETHIARLIAAGHKVAIVEQVGEEPGRGIMERQVVRVVTPGTVIEPGLLDARRNNYLVAVARGDGRSGLALADITTGEFAGTELDTSEGMELLWEELVRLQPAELLVAPDWEEVVRAWAAERNNDLQERLTVLEGWRWDLGVAQQVLRDHFGVASLAAYGCDDKPAVVIAAAAVVQYLQRTQKGALAQLESFSTYSIESFMVLDQATRRNLEIVEGIRSRSSKGSLLAVLDRTVTAMGARLLRRWLLQPLLRVQDIVARQRVVATFYAHASSCAVLQKGLQQCADLERLTNRVVAQVATPRELLALRTTLATVPVLQDELNRLADAEHVEGYEEMRTLVSDLDPCLEVADLIGAAIADDAPASVRSGGYIRAGYSAELDEIRAGSQDAKQWVADLERRERERTGIKTLRVGYNKVFGYYIEVTRAHLNSVPADYIRKQTLVNGERFVTPDLKEKEALILNADERVNELEADLYRRVLHQIAGQSARLLHTAQALAQLDAFLSLAEVARRNAYCRPEVDDGEAIEIVGGRHPVVEQSMAAMDFVPNDVRLVPDQNIIVLTGPNMSGKSTYLRQTALIVLMAQIGSFVPATSAHIGVVDRIFTRVGAQDEIAAGQSTFMVEMLETALILSQSTRRSLLILDEVGRGTSTYDGLAIAQAVVEYIHNSPRLQSKTLFATHFHELTALEKYLPRVRNYNVAVVEDGDRVVFLHKIVPGGADRSYGIHVAEIAGVPRPVIKRARELLDELERRMEGRERSGGRGSRAKAQVSVGQLPLLGAGHPVVEVLRSLRVDEMSPLEALAKLYELQKSVREG